MTNFSSHREIDGYKMPSIANGDVRKDYVLSTVANYFGVEARDELYKNRSSRNIDSRRLFSR